MSNPNEAMRAATFYLFCFFFVLSCVFSWAVEYNRQEDIRVFFEQQEKINKQNKEILEENAQIKPYSFKSRIETLERWVFGRIPTKKEIKDEQ